MSTHVIFLQLPIQSGIWVINIITNYCAMNFTTSMHVERCLYIAIQYYLAWVAMIQYGGTVTYDTITAILLVCSPSNKANHSCENAL